MNKQEKDEVLKHIGSFLFWLPIIFIVVPVISIGYVIMEIQDNVFG